MRYLADTVYDDAAEISIDLNKSTAPKINQWLITVDKDKKSALLSHLINQQNWQQALIFIRTKHGAAKLVSQLEKRGIKAESIHSGRSQAVRLPKEFRFDCQEVFIRQDPDSGDVVISKKPGNWEGFFSQVDSLLERQSVPSSFLQNRDNDIEEERDLF